MRALAPSSIQDAHTDGELPHHLEAGTPGVPASRRALPSTLQAQGCVRTAGGSQGRKNLPPTPLTNPPAQPRRLLIALTLGPPRGNHVTY